MLRLGAVEVLEAWLEEDAVSDDVLVQGSHVIDHHVLLIIIEDLFEIWRVRKGVNL